MIIHFAQMIIDFNCILVHYAIMESNLKTGVFAAADTTRHERGVSHDRQKEILAAPQPQNGQMAVPINDTRPYPLCIIQICSYVGCTNLFSGL